jgi:hypothetical protein
MAGKPSLEPIYPCTEKLKARINGNNFGKFTAELFTPYSPKDPLKAFPQNIEQYNHRPGTLLTGRYIFLHQKKL